MTIAQSTAQAPSHGVKARRHALLACGAAMALAAVWLHWRYGQGWSHRSAHAWGSDDAYITYRYAVNLLQGWGPVFNPGEAVEGYSNPLYLIVVTALMAAVGPEQVYAASVALDRKSTRLNSSH